MNEIELRKAVIFIMWLRQAQPPCFVLCLQTFGLCSAIREENYYEVLELNTPSFRFSECHPSKRGEL